MDKGQKLGLIVSLPVVLSFVIAFLVVTKQSLQVSASFIAVVLAGFMFSDTFLGSVDMASASVKYIYDKAATSLHNPVNDFPAEEREQFEAVRKLKVGGLYNEGNTCFMNTVVQSLASLQHLKRVLQANVDHNDAEMSLVLNQLVDKLNKKNPSKHSYSTQELIKSLGQESRYSSYDQEDAQEFFQALLNGLEKDIEKRVTIDKKKPDEIVTPFDGVCATRVGCLQCGEMEGIRRGIVSSLDLGLSNLSRAKGDEIQLEKLIDEYCLMETISGVECYRCSLIQWRDDLKEKIETSASPQIKQLFEQRLNEVLHALEEKIIDEKKYELLKPKTHKQQCNKSKQTMLATPTSDIIMIHINRSVFNMYTGATTKNYTPVKFPSILDMRKYVIDTDSEINNNPAIPMQATDEPGTGMMYTLKAVIVHFGSHNFGHYVCYRKCDQGYWWRISDHSVELAYEHQVLNAQGVFMLFYEKMYKANTSNESNDNDNEGTDITDMMNNTKL